MIFSLKSRRGIVTFNALRIRIAMIDIVEIKESLRDAISVILLNPVLGKEVHVRISKTGIICTT